MPRSRRGCEHYERGCKLLAPCCQQFYWCRHCHNQQHCAEMQGHSRHKLDRHKIREVLCMNCDTRQPIGLACFRCGTQFGEYACLKCNFFDDDTSKQQFHCDECGICRTGGRENYFHCTTCGCCYSWNLQANHQCIENNLQHPCPVCAEYLFDSVEQITVLPCGHALHKRCHTFVTAARISTCLLCARTPEDTALTRLVVERAVGQLGCQRPPLHSHAGHSEAAPGARAPPGFAPPRAAARADEKVDVLCLQCRLRCVVEDGPFGQQCSACGSFDTRPLSVLPL